MADKQDYRHDTPLQCTIDGMCGAQMVIFGLFGVAPQFDGTVSVTPHLPPFSRRMALRGLMLRGKTMDIELEGQRFKIQAENETQEGDIGQRITVR